jgi:hypothetical protein
MARRRFELSSDSDKNHRIFSVKTYNRDRGNAFEYQPRSLSSNYLEKEMSGKLTVKFINGEEKSFEFDPQGQFAQGAATKLKEMVASNALIIQLESEIEIIPFANIQDIIVIPAEPELLKKIKIASAVVVTNRC